MPGRAPPSPGQRMVVTTKLMESEVQRIERAVPRLENLHHQLVSGDLEPTSELTEGGGTLWKLDSRVEAVKDLLHWWRHYPILDEEAAESLDWLMKETVVGGQARRLIATVVDGIQTCGQLKAEDPETWQPYEDRLRVLLDLIAARGTLQLKRGINRTVNGWIVLAVLLVVFFGAMAFSQGTLLQSLPFAAPVLVLLVLLKVYFLTRPIRQLRSRIAAIETEWEDLA